MDATARAAGVSKGGLLYHFGSKEALEAGLLERLRHARRRGHRRHHVRARGRRSPTSCAPPSCTTTRSTARSSRPHASPRAAARPRARRCATSGSGGRTPSVRTRADQAALDLVMLVSDGLYFNNALDGGAIPGPVPRGADLERSSRSCGARRSPRSGCLRLARVRRSDASSREDRRVRCSIAFTTSGCTRLTGVK